MSNEVSEHHTFCVTIMRHLTSCKSILKQIRLAHLTVENIYLSDIILFLFLYVAGEFHLRLRQLEKSLLQALNDTKGKILDDDR